MKLIYVNQCWHFMKPLTVQSLFLEENKHAWKMEMDERKMFLYNVYTESIFTVVL